MKNKLSKTEQPCTIHSVRQSFPSYNELLEAFKDTHNLYLEAIKNTYLTHDITRVIGNENIFKRIDDDNFNYVAIIHISNSVLIKKSTDTKNRYDIYYDGIPKTWVNASKFIVENNYAKFYDDAS